ncbi:aquaporin NIP6-1-like [Bidens hawaiensis]|uniref:aquaporin NIP6-1-like n=1 Tax=Bidens hawaiensis TaxID=980011 RepID=UPI0040496172
MDSEDNGSAPSTPVTPGTPGAPLFSGFRPDRNHGSNNFRKSLLSSFKCFSVETLAKEEGTLPSVTCYLPPPPISLARKVGAEFIGTITLIFAGTATAIVNQKTPGSETLIGLAGSSGLAVMIVILSTGHISGAHLNPSITIAFAALKHFPWKHVPLYIGAQVLASICAAFTLKVVFDPMMGGGVTVPSISYGQAFALEFIISFKNLYFFQLFILFPPSLSLPKAIYDNYASETLSSATYVKVGELAGIAVGATVMLNILIAGPVTGGSMNPVRTLGPAIAANNFKGLWIYLTAPILGALAGAGIYTAVKLPEEDGNDPSKSQTHSFRR